MLGLSSGLIKGASTLRSIVKSGLQAWYKADKTQAPLGEEKVLNGNFNLGPELVTNGSFSGIADGTDSILVDGAAEGWRAYGTPISRNIVNEQLVIVTDEVLGSEVLTNGDFSTSGTVSTTSHSLGWIIAANSNTGVEITNGQLILTGDGTVNSGRVYAGQTSSGFLSSGIEYELTYTIDFNSGTDLRYHGGSGYVALPSDKETVGTHTIRFTAGASEIFVLLQNTNGGVTKFSNISLKEVIGPDNKGVRYDVSGATAGETYKIQFDVLQGAGGSSVYSSNPNATLNVSSATPQNPTQTFYKVIQNNGAFSVYFRGPNNGSGTAIYDNISIKKVDPNDTWSIAQGTSTGSDGWIIKDGFAEAVGTGNNDDLKATILTIGKRYKATFTASDGMGNGTNFYVGDAAFNDYAIITTNGTHTHEWIAASTTFTIRRKSNTTVKVSNVSVREVTNSIKDHSTNVNDATLYSGTALHFDGSADRVELGAASNLVGYDNFTVAFWAKTNMTAAQNDVRFFTASKNSSSTYFSIGMDSNKRLQFYLRNTSDALNTGSGEQLVDSNAINDDKWRRIVVSVQPKLQNFYVDNKLLRTFRIEKGDQYTSDSYLGGGPSATSNLLTGDIADFQVYNKAWTPSDVEFDYNNPDKDVFDDKDRSEVLSSELIFNNDFSNGTTGWEPEDNGATIEVGAFKGRDNVAKINILDTANNDRIRQEFDRGTYAINGDGFKQNTFYSVEVDVFVESGDFRLDTPNGDIDTNFITTSVTGSWQTLKAIVMSESTAGASSPAGYVWLRSVNSVAEFYVDKVSFKEITTHAAEILPTDCKALYRLNEGAGNILYNAAPVLSEELLVGNISLAGGDTTGFTLVGNPTINNAGSADDFLDLTTGASSNNVLKQTIATEVGALYIFQFELVNSQIPGETATTMAIAGRPSSSNTDDDVTSYTNTPGVKKLFFKPSTISTDLFVRAGTSVRRVQLRNVSAKKVTPATSVAQTSWAFTNWIKQQPYIPQYAISSYSKKMIFDGQTDSVNCGNQTSIHNVFTDGGTWSCWVSPNNFGQGGNPDVIVKGNVRLRVASDSGTPIVRFLKSFSGNNGNWKTPAISHSKLTHIAVTYNSNSPSNNPSIYVNGIKQTVTATSTPTGSASSDAGSTMSIGGSIGSLYNYEGFVDEISVFDKILTEAEVQEIFNNGTALDVRDHSCYYGSELISNTDLTSGLSGWTISNAEGSTHTVTATPNGARFFSTTTSTPSGETLRFGAGVNLIDGKFYRLEVVISEDNGENPIKIESGAEPKITFKGVGTHVHEFQAIGSTSSGIRFYRDGINVDTTIQSVSLKEIQTVSYWRNNGVDTWTDLSPYGNNGTVFNNYSEEVLNGGFSNTSNWTAGSGANLSVSGGHLVVECPATDNYVNAHQQLNLEIGSTYVFSVEMVSATNNSQAKIDTSATGTSTTLISLSSTDVGFGIRSGTFVATSANPYIQLRAFGDNTSVHQAQFDNVSVKKLENQIRLQEVPLFNKDSLGLPMNKLRRGGLNFEEGYIQTSGRLQRSNLSAITLEAWVYAYDEGAHNQGVIGSSSTSYLLYRPRSSNYYRLYINGGSPDDNSGAQTGVLALKQWHHIVAVYDKTLTKEQNIYVNGASVNTKAGADADGFANPANGALNADVTLNSTHTMVGKYSGVNFYGGIIDDAKIYDRRLTLKEIKRNYNATKGRHKN